MLLFFKKFSGDQNKSKCFVKQKSAKEVRKYSCLYNKSDATYKHKVRKDNAWAKIDETPVRASRLIRF